MNHTAEVESSWELDDSGNAIITIVLPTQEALAFEMCSSWYNQLRETKAKPQIVFHLQGKGDFVTTPLENLEGLPARYAKKQGSLNKLKQIPAEPNAPDYCYIFFQDHTGNRYYLGNNEWDKEQFLIQLPEKATPPTPEERASRLCRQADDAFAKGDYVKAKELYNNILALAPNSHTSHARERVGEIERVEKRQEKSITIDYKLEQIKQTYAAQQYAECLVLCEQVLNDVDANETQKDLARRYAIECREKLNSQKAETDLLAYQELIRTADGFFEQKKWLEAKKFYQDALSLRAEEVYPKEQIKKIDAIFANERKKRAFVWAKGAGIAILLLLFCVSVWYASQTKPAWEGVQARKVLRVGLHTYSPIDKDKFAETIAQKILELTPELKGVTLKIDTNAHFKHLSDMLKSDELDMVFYAGMGQNDAENLIWSQESYWTFDKVLAYKGEKKEEAYFIGKTVEIHEKDRSVGLLKTGWKLQEMTDGRSDYLAENSKGKELAGVICDLPTCLQLRKQGKKMQYSCIKGHEGKYALAFKNTNGAMQDAVDKLLVKIKRTKEYKDLVEKLEQ